MTVEDNTGIMQFMFFGNPEKRLVKNTMLNLIALANGDPMTLPQPFKALENQKKIFQLSITKQSLDKANPHFSIIFVNETQESTYDPSFPLLPAPSPAEPELDSQKGEGSQKRKLPIEDEHLTSPTEETIPQDLFSQDSPAKTPRKR